MILIQLLLISVAWAQYLGGESSDEEILSQRIDSNLKSLDAAIAHHVIVVYSRSYCSGSFIHSKIVLTVASCFNEKINEYVVNVKFAVQNYMDKGPSLTVAEIKEHEFYKHRGNLDNDIALLVLKDHIMFGFGEKKILLANPATVLPTGSYITVMGWGKDVSKSQENSLLSSDMQLISREECEKTFPKNVFPSTFCAKFDLANRLSDNGGAALYNGLVVGISSYGANLDDLPSIALFTNVSYFYKWIKLNTNKLLVKHCSQEFKGVDNDSPDLSTEFSS